MGGCELAPAHAVCLDFSPESLWPGGRLCLRDALAFMAVGDDVSGGLALHELYFQTAEPMTWNGDVSYVPTPEDVVGPEVAAAMRTSLR